MDAAGVGRIAQRSADVRTYGEVSDAGGDGGGTTARRAARVSAEPRGLRVAPSSELLVNQRSAKVGALLRPRSTAPARTRFSTAGLFTLATKSF